MSGLIDTKTVVAGVVSGLIVYAVTRFLAKKEGASE